MVNINKLPRQLKELDQWVVWRLEEKDGRLTKIPYNPKTLNGAMSNNPKTWTSLVDAYACLINNPNFNGLGFMLNDSNIVCIDLDNKDNAMTDQDFKDLLHDCLKEVPSYCEISQSGKGYHIFAKGKLPEGKRKSKNVEMYDDTRYIAITGDVLGAYTEITEQQEGINLIHERYLGTRPRKMTDRAIFDDIPISKPSTVENVLKRAKNDAKFLALYRGEWKGLDYPSQSEADTAFANKLAVYADYNAETMDAVFRSSGLYREKYERKQKGSTYGKLLLDDAIMWSWGKKQEDENTELVSYGSAKKVEAVLIDTPIIEEKKIITTSKYTDTANAMSFLEDHRDYIRYNFDNKAWFVWDGKKWDWDKKGKIKQFADITAERLLREAKKGMDDYAFKNAQRVLNNAGKNNMIAEAQHQEGIGILNEDLDRNEFYINTEDGIYDFENDKMREHSPKEYMSKITSCGISFDEPKIWLKFINEVFLGDEEIINYVQKAVGYSLTGSIREQKLFIVYGGGNNGKSVFMDTLQKIMGDYSANVATEVLMEKKGQGNKETTLARVKGKRLISASENDEEDQLNEGLVKQITGGEKVIGRFLYGNEFEYYPEYKAWISTNNKPKIKGTDFGIWRRLIIIPFNLQLTEAQADKTLVDKLEKELDMILGWAINGYKKYAVEGLILPEVLEKEKEQYKIENDYISNFIYDKIDKKDGYKIGATTVYKEFEKWCKETNTKVPSSVYFGKEFGKHFKKRREGQGTMYLDCLIKMANVDYIIKEFT